MKTLQKNRLYKLSYSLKSLILFSLAIILLSSCRKNDDDDQPQPDLSAFSVINASPGQTTYNFALDNQIINGPALIYTQQSGYITAYSGVRKFDATLGGTTQSVLTTPITLEKDKYYSLFISGESASLSAFITEDDGSAPAAGKAKVRFVQLSPDAGTLTLGIKGGATLFPSQAFKTASAFSSIDPADYTLEIKSSEGAALKERIVTFSAGKIYTVWAGGMLAGTGNAAIGINVNANN